MTEKHDRPPESCQLDIDIEDKKGSAPYLPQTSEEDITESSGSGVLQDVGSPEDVSSPDPDPAAEKQKQGSVGGQKKSKSKAVLITFALCVCLCQFNVWI